MGIARTALLASLAATLGAAVACAPSTKRRRHEPPPLPVEDRREPRPQPPAPDPSTTWPELFAAPDAPVFTAAGLGVTREEYDAGFAEFAARNPEQPDVRAAWEASLRERLLVLAWLKRRIDKDPALLADGSRDALREELAGIVVAAETEAATRVTEDEIRARYERDKAKYSEEPRASISMILVPTEQEATTANRRLAAGESFAIVASEMSIHSSRTAGGEIEPFVRGTYNEALEDLAFSLAPRERGTIATPRGVFIVEKVAEMRGSTTPLAQVHGRIEADIRGEKSAHAYHELLARIESELGIH